MDDCCGKRLLVVQLNRRAHWSRYSIMRDAIRCCVSIPSCSPLHEIFMIPTSVCVVAKQLPASSASSLAVLNSTLLFALIANAAHVVEASIHSVIFSIVSGLAT
eukprot:Lankesteria_metandrocarpae@DN7279_c0_g1_i1.p1